MKYKKNIKFLVLCFYYVKNGKLILLAFDFCQLITTKAKHESETCFVTGYRGAKNNYNQSNYSMCNSILQERDRAGHGNISGLLISMYT